MSKEHVFDDLARTADSGMPRRQALKLAVGLALSQFLPIAFIKDAEAVGTCTYDPKDGRPPITFDCLGVRVCKNDSTQYASCCLPTTPRPTANTSLVVGPPTALDITVQNSANGISFLDVQLVNCTVPNMPLNTGGTTSPVLITATKTNQALPAQILVNAWDVNGCGPYRIDPVFTTLQLTTGRWVRQTFTDIPTAEHYITVTNGAPGLSTLAIRINGRVFATLRLAENEVRNLDVAAAMELGDHNTVTLTGKGELGAGADVTILDTAPAAVTPIGPKPPKRHGGHGAADPTRFHNQVWGPLAEEAEETDDLHAVDSAKQRVQVHFTGAVDSFVAGDRGLYTVKVNGKEQDVQSAKAAEGPDGVQVMLQLAPRTLKGGDQVDVYWDELADAKGRPLSGHVALGVPHVH